MCGHWHISTCYRVVCAYVPWRVALQGLAAFVDTGICRFGRSGVWALTAALLACLFLTGCPAGNSSRPGVFLSIDSICAHQHTHMMQLDWVSVV